MNYALAAAYSLGAYLIQNNLFGMDLEKVMLVFGCIMMGAQSVGMFKHLKILFKKSNFNLNELKIKKDKRRVYYRTMRKQKHQ